MGLRLMERVGGINEGEFARVSTCIKNHPGGVESVQKEDLAGSWILERWCIFLLENN